MSHKGLFFHGLRVLPIMRENMVTGAVCKWEFTWAENKEYCIQLSRLLLFSTLLICAPAHDMVPSTFRLGIQLILRKGCCKHNQRYASLMP